MAEAITLTPDTPEVAYLMQRDKHLAKVITMVGPLSYTFTTNRFGFLVSEIIGQMLSNRATNVIIARVNALSQQELTPAAVAQLSDDQLRHVGISTAKIKYMHNLTAAVLNQTINLTAVDAWPDQQVLSHLTQVHGIGQWSAKMFLIFVLQRPNVLPFEDGAFLQSYQWVYRNAELSPQAMIKKCRKWRPYSSIAARYMYAAVDQNLTKEPFHLYK